MAAIHDLLAQVQDQALRERIEKEIEKLSKTKRFGLVFEEHMPECTPLYDVPVKRGGTVAKRNGSVSDVYEVLGINGNLARCVNRVTQNIEDILLEELVSVAQFGEAVYPYLKPIDSICNAPESSLWHALIEADNYHALQLIEYLYAGKVDCIYIDPPYNTGAKDWKYNNDYVDSSDSYRHSKWLSFMEKRLRLAKKLLNPKDSVLIVTIDEKEYLHLGCLLEEVFSDAKIQMISSAINGKGVARDSEFARVNEYIFVVRIGEASVNALFLPDEWMGNVKTSTTNQVRWGSLMRSGSGALRTDSPGCFYPIYISKDKKHFCGAGDVVPVGVDRNTVSVPDDVIALFPIHDDGVEGRWQYSRDKYLEIQKKGYVRISTQTSKGKEATLRYISEGWQKKVESGQITVLGYDEDGSVLLDDSDYTKEFVPGNQWWIPSHDATEFGSKLLTSIIGKRFSFPKSLYAVEDTLRFFVKNKKDALILDFFAGSGTTLHAVNLLNAKDDGNRRCILVTNNEVSVEEAAELEKKGLHPGDEEWNKLGIARYVTWPRTICSIRGEDINGKPLKGKYINTDRNMSDGFSANAILFKLGFLDKTAVALGRQLSELIPLLWMKAGAYGECPKLDDERSKMLILPQNRMAILIDEKSFLDFETEIEKCDGIETIYFVTDSEAGYREMASKHDDKNTYQLYRDYLDNFRINVRR
ncbi:MAG: DNA methyltransferase [Lachnospiraceae bacterium]|nr:DNA methyltransferase [Lachnospiraceae bacterium]